MACGLVRPDFPGHRFHPTDEELLLYYLKRQNCNKSFKKDIISVLDIYESEPWDLPDKSKLKSRDLVWFFFTLLSANGSKTNRSTEQGYWKITGKDREIVNDSGIIGMKKTFVYHQGRIPRGERTNWVMHEYRLVDENLKKSSAYVLCKIFKKSGYGGKIGEEYGAPFLEEEWEDEEEEEDDDTFVPDQDHVFDEDKSFKTDTSDYFNCEAFQQNDLRSTQQDNFDTVNFRTLLFEVEEYSQDELFQKV